MEDLNEKLHLKLQTENYDTLSGYLIEKLDYIPADEKVEPILVGKQRVYFTGGEGQTHPEGETAHSRKVVEGEKRCTGY